MSRHEAVSCDACLKNNFKGRRYKCLTCYDYDLCSSCYENGAAIAQHTTSHPMQCILTRHDFDVFYGGEALTADQPHSLTCPFCGKMGFTERTLQDHVTANHLDAACGVVCPICAVMPGGEPNNVTDDFAAHLSLDHPSGAPRELDVAESGGRHGPRRMPHQGRGLGRGVVRQNMRFGSVNNGFFSSSSRSESSMDPIAELLSQLSGVRRTTASDLLSTAADSHLDQPLQPSPRTQQSSAERLPTRRSGVTSSGLANASSSSSQTSNAANGNVVSGALANNINYSSSGFVAGTQGPVIVSLGGGPSAPAPTVATSTTHQIQSTPTNKQQQSQFLLARLGDAESTSEDPSRLRSRATFVQDLLISTLSEFSVCPDASTERPATPVPSTYDVATQTTPSVPSSPTNTHSTTLFPLVKTSSASSVPPAKSKPVKVLGRGTPTTPGPLFPQSHASSVSRVVVTGTGTLSVPSFGSTGNAGTPQGTTSGRRKPVRGVDGGKTGPTSPPH